MTLNETYPIYVANAPELPNTNLIVTDKYSGETATRTALADPATIDRAIAAAVQAAEPMARMAAYERRAILDHCVQRFTERAEELAQLLRIEAGKPIKDSRGEVSRLIDTFRIAATESVRPAGEILEPEVSARTRGYRGWTKRVPIGPCSFISPFNFPLNLAAHKIAPALAVGCPFVLKPASKTPLGALVIGEILAETDLPEGAFSILPCSRDGADLFTTDERLKLLSFTGSPDVGWKLKAKAGKKKVILELGGNAACILDEGADLDDAIDRIITGAFYQSGQSCISVQRILVHQSLAAEFETRFVAAIRKLKSGDPADEDVFIGPMISESEAQRLEDWIAQAKAAGADVFIGVSRGGLLDAADIRTMAPDAIVFALANPAPEIDPDEARAGGAAVVATGRSDYPNQVNNVLAFPGIFRGALDADAPRITDAMKIAAARAIAGTIAEPTAESILPAALDPEVARRVAEAVADAS